MVRKFFRPTNTLGLSRFHSNRDSRKALIMG